jgi:hypothetical protein
MPCNRCTHTYISNYNPCLSCILHLEDPNIFSKPLEEIKKLNIINDDIIDIIISYYIDYSINTPLYKKLSFVTECVSWGYDDATTEQKFNTLYKLGQRGYPFSPLVFEHTTFTNEQYQLLIGFCYEKVWYYSDTKEKF